MPTVMTGSESFTNEWIRRPEKIFCVKWPVGLMRAVIFTTSTSTTGSAAAREALERIAALFAIEAEIRGQQPESRLAIREKKSAPLLAELKAFLTATLAAISGKSTLANAIRYALSRWEALCRFTSDGRLEMENNAAERAIRPLVLGRKNYLFAGSDEGASWCSSHHVIEKQSMSCWRSSGGGRRDRRDRRVAARRRIVIVLEVGSSNNRRRAFAETVPREERHRR